MNGIQVSHWSKSKGSEQFVYDEDWLNDPQGRHTSEEQEIRSGTC
ncbi:hypothetical protein [Chitinimonas lacunae]|uniref:Uncharacterized protein n=1 Tax=Chitinimonas lacunae TaxID=1963018 RepID=A0ABV8MT19_9NEIS